ncbi:unnamed protein product, partial [marine sediment metagenome]
PFFGGLCGKSNDALESLCERSIILRLLSEPSRIQSRQMGSDVEINSDFLLQISHFAIVQLIIKN